MLSIFRSSICIFAIHLHCVSSNNRGIARFTGKTKTKPRMNPHSLLLVLFLVVNGISLLIHSNETIVFHHMKAAFGASYQSDGLSLERWYSL